MATTENNKKKRTEMEDFSLPKDFFSQINFVSVDSLKTQDNRIFICKRNDKLIEVWKGLIKHKFHSVPVLLKTSDKYYGMIDLHDISRYVLNFFGKGELSNIEDFWKNVDKADKLKNVTVDDVMKSPLTRENIFKPVTSGYSLHFALELMAREPSLHRIPIITRERKLVNMLTMSRLIQFFHDNKNILGNRINKPISVFGSSTNGVISIKQTQIAWDAFELMQTHTISAVAVVDDKEKLVGVISDTDLKTISEDGSLFYKLHQDAKTFLKSKEKTAPKLVIARPNNTFGEVIDMLFTNKVHRVFVCNDQQIPSGVLSLKDIMDDVMIRS